MHEKPVFALFEGEKKLLFSYVGEDEDDREQQLKKYLDLIKASGSYATFYIFFYEEQDKKKKITNATPYFGSLPFKLNEAGMDVAQPGGRTGVQGNFNMELMNQVFAGKLDLMRMEYQQQVDDLKRIHEKELEDATAEEEEGRADADDIIGRIGQAGERYPWMQEHIKDGITIVKHLVKKFTNGVLGDDLGMGPASGTIAGAPQGANPNEKLQWSIKTMLTYYHGKYGNQENGDKEFADDMERLANMCTTDADLFDLMIKKLRAAA